MKVALTPRPSVNPAPPAPNPASPPGVDPDQAAADAALRDAFSDSPEDAPPPLPTPEKPLEPILEEKKEVVEEKKPEPSVEPVDELDKPPEGVVLPKTTSKDLRSQLEKRNADYKQLEGEKKLHEEELTKLRKEVEELRGKSPEPVEAVDFKNDPAVTKHTTVIHNDVKATARVIGGEAGKKLALTFYDKDQGYLRQFVEASSVEGVKGDEMMDTLRSRLDTELGEDSAKDAMSLLNRSLPAYQQAMSELKRLEADTHNHSTRKSVEKYTAAEKEVSTLLDPLGELPDEVISAKPYAPESFVSKLISSDPKWLAQSQKVKAFIKEVFVGVKPLTPEERQKMEANNDGGLSEVETTRQKKHQENRQAAMRRLYHSMMILPNLPALLEELEGLRSSQAQGDSELDALETVPVARPSPKSNGTAAVRDLKKDLLAVFSGKELDENG